MRNDVTPWLARRKRNGMKLLFVAALGVLVAWQVWVGSRPSRRPEKVELGPYFREAAFYENDVSLEADPYQFTPERPYYRVVWSGGLQGEQTCPLTIEMGGTKVDLSFDGVRKLPGVEDLFAGTLKEDKGEAARQSRGSSFLWKEESSGGMLSCLYGADKKLLSVEVRLEAPVAGQAGAEKKGVRVSMGKGGIRLPCDYEELIKEWGGPLEHKKWKSARSVAPREQVISGAGEQLMKRGR